ncbi:hypothetical protein [Candidatus Cytomitobacter primus]|uniref:Uncharacterized protein n=1 Tax=Candidatus Cytomitobacter primus TaxID=2066024 RepID=A0A5C0UI35_9PROT|nr:hypothetical protein [Candidatus Cytomitobacter primus]QEK38614.1 hypothetical protein FZC34_01685 [Candidatus Cytomitobacter primus]
MNLHLFLQETKKVVVSDSSWIFWLKNSFPKIEFTYTSLDEIINSINSGSFNLSSLVINQNSSTNNMSADSFITSANKTISTNKLILQSDDLAEIEGKISMDLYDAIHSDSIHLYGIYILKKRKINGVCLEFTDVIEEAKYVIESIKRHDKPSINSRNNISIQDKNELLTQKTTHYFIATDSQIMKNTLLSMNPDLRVFDDKAYKYERFVFLQCTKLLLNINKEYENKELMNIYQIDKSYIGQLVIEVSDLLSIWNNNIKLIKQFNIEVLNNYIESIDELIRNKIQINDQYTNDTYNLIEKTNRKDYIKFLEDIMTLNMNMQCKLQNHIVPINAIPYLFADNLYICNPVNHNLDLFCFNENYININISCNASSHIHAEALKNITINTVQNNCAQSALKLQFKFNDLKIKQHLIPKKIFSIKLRDIKDDILIFYVKCILGLKSINYEIDDYITYHVKVILCNYFVEFNINEVEKYLYNSNFAALDAMKIKIKSYALIHKVQSIVDFHNIVKNSITKKMFNIYEEINLNIANAVIINSHYDCFYILQNKSGILFKFMYFTTINQKDILLMRNLYINIIVLTASNLLFKYNLWDIKLCFVTVNEIFTVLLSEINFSDLYFIIEKQIKLPIYYNYDFGFKNINMNYKLINLVRYYDYMG